MESFNDVANEMPAETSGEAAARPVIQIPSIFTSRLPDDYYESGSPPERDDSTPPPLPEAECQKCRAFTIPVPCPSCNTVLCADCIDADVPCGCFYDAYGLIEDATLCAHCGKPTKEPPCPDCKIPLCVPCNPDGQHCQCYVDGTKGTGIRLTPAPQRITLERHRRVKKEPDHDTPDIPDTRPDSPMEMDPSPITV